MPCIETHTRARTNVRPYLPAHAGFVSTYQFVLVCCAATVTLLNMLPEYRTSFSSLFAVATLLYIEVGLETPPCVG